MNYYTARQIARDGQPTGLWHYTLTNDHRTRPTGYCATGCPGHATADAAREHYRQYLLDNARYDGQYSGVAHQCAVCGQWTAAFAALDPGQMDHYLLCDAHRDRATLARLVPLPGDVISSY